MGFFDGIGGALIGGVASLIGGERQNEAAENSAQAANRFTERQLKSRHQWEVADLKAAGLNPVLSAGGTPSIGGSSTAAVPSNSIGDAVSSAMQALRLREDIKNIRADTDLKKDNATAARAMAVNSLASAKLTSTTDIQKGALTPVYEGIRKITSSSGRGLNERADEYKDKGFMKSSTPVLGWLLNKFGFGNSAKAFAR